MTYFLLGYGIASLSYHLPDLFCLGKLDGLLCRGWIIRLVVPKIMAQSFYMKIYSGLHWHCYYTSLLLSCAWHYLLSIYPTHWGFSLAITFIILMNVEWVAKLYGKGFFRSSLLGFSRCHDVFMLLMMILSLPASHTC